MSYCTSSSYCVIVDVAVQFSKDTFATTEVSQAMDITLELLDGVLDTDVTVTVVTTEQTATGIQFIY